MREVGGWQQALEYARSHPNVPEVLRAFSMMAEQIQTLTNRVNEASLSAFGPAPTIIQVDAAKHQLPYEATTNLAEANDRIRILREYIGELLRCDILTLEDMWKRGQSVLNEDAIKSITSFQRQNYEIWAAKNPSVMEGDAVWEAWIKSALAREGLCNDSITREPDLRSPKSVEVDPL